MNKPNNKLKTFCPLPWNHISASPKGAGRVCCEGFKILKDDQGQTALWKNSSSLHSYLNTKDYKKIRQQMLKGERPDHCVHCFNQEDHGVHSIRLQYIEQHQQDIKKMINNTNEDGSIDNPQITYIDMALGNKCNLKCRMCSPWNSYIIGKEWEKMGKTYNEAGARKILEDKWYASPNTLQMIKEALPHIQAIFTTGGEPMLIKEHLKILEMIIEEGHAHHVLLRYNSNQTVIPEAILKLWKHFQKVAFNCSIEASGALNDYIRYPSK
ncbi:MAG: twitch domain-containing radical SAM protein, partial [Oligoflexia bacterium]|nr:twitch domain-containing radical SAM protein [Oligoflexia bacterium]